MRPYETLDDGCVSSEGLQAAPLPCSCKSEGNTLNNAVYI